MSIPVGMSYASHVSGSTVKTVVCEQCQKEYLYQLERTGSGTGATSVSPCAWISRNSPRQLSSIVA